MATMKKLAIATALALSASGAYAAAVVTFSNTSLGGTSTFQFDQIVTTSVGASTIAAYGAMLLRRSAALRTSGRRAGLKRARVATICARASRS